MARAILVIGEPGTGKTRAIKNLDPKTTVVIKPNSKELPFRGGNKNYVQGRNMFTVRTLKGVGDLLNQINQAKQIKTIIVEDLTHYFAKRVIDERAVKGYDKWTELAAHTKIHIIDKETELRPDLNLIVIGHVTSVSDAAGNTSVGIQTPGKLMDNSIKIPSYFTYVLHTFVDQGDDNLPRYRFLTNKDGIREAKTPEEMFPLYIPNDYAEVIRGIEAYQNEEGITPVGKTLEEKAKEVPPPAETAKTEPVAEPSAATADGPPAETKPETATGQEAAK